MINITHFLQHNSAGAVAVAPAELMQLVEFTSCYKTVVLFKASNFQFQYNNIAIR